jgi:hypothetical protein
MHRFNAATHGSSGTGAFRTPFRGLSVRQLTATEETSRMKNISQSIFILRFIFFKSLYVKLLLKIIKAIILKWV